MRSPMRLMTAILCFGFLKISAGTTTAALSASLSPYKSAILPGLFRCSCIQALTSDLACFSSGVKACLAEWILLRVYASLFVLNIQSINGLIDMLVQSEFTKQLNHLISLEGLAARVWLDTAITDGGLYAIEGLRKGKTFYRATENGVMHLIGLGDSSLVNHELLNGHSLNASSVDRR